MRLPGHVEVKYRGGFGPGWTDHAKKALGEMKGKKVEREKSSRTRLVAGEDFQGNARFKEAGIDVVLDDSYWDEDGPLHDLANRFPSDKERVALCAVANTILAFYAEQQANAGIAAGDDRLLCRYFSGGELRTRAREAMKRNRIRTDNDTVGFYIATAQTVINQQSGERAIHTRTSPSGKLLR